MPSVRALADDDHVGLPRAWRQLRRDALEARRGVLCDEALELAIVAAEEKVVEEEVREGVHHVAVFHVAWGVDEVDEKRQCGQACDGHGRPAAPNWVEGDFTGPRQKRQRREVERGKQEELTLRNVLPDELPRFAHV